MGRDRAFPGGAIPGLRRAYITHDGYMQAMVTTFDGGALKKK